MCLGPAQQGAPEAPCTAPCPCSCHIPAPTNRCAKNKRLFLAPYVALASTADEGGGAVAESIRIGSLMHQQGMAAPPLRTRPGLRAQPHSHGLSQAGGRASPGEICNMQGKKFKGAFSWLEPGRWQGVSWGNLQGKKFRGV
jgi:hypothetical protein